MKNLKKLLAVIVAICVLATFTVPAFAEEAVKTDAEICADLKVLEGTTSGVDAEYLAKGTTRIQAAIISLRLAGKEDEALAFEGTENFADADEVQWAGGKAALAYLKANPELGWSGSTSGKFFAYEAASAQMIYKVLLEGLGYKQGVDFEWAEVIETAAEKGLVKVADVTELTNNDVAVAIVEALKVNVKDTEKTLAATLVEAGAIDKDAAIAAGLYSAEATVTVAATGAKKLTVTFNQAVDSTKAAITVKKGTVAVNTDKIEFAEDKKSAVITTTTNLTEGDYTVSVAGLTETAITATVKVENEKIAEIKMLSDKAPRVSNTVAAGLKQANVSYEVLNQYGEKVTGKSVTWTTTSTFNGADTTGMLTLTSATDFIPGTIVYLTGVYASGANVVTISTKVEIVLASQSDTVAFKGVYKIADKKIVDLPAGFEASKFVLLYEVKDQYGNKIASPTFADLSFISNNPLFVKQDFVAGTPVTIDDVLYEAVKLVPGDQAAKGGTVQIMAVSTLTGKTSTFDVTSEALAAVKSLTISAPSAIIAEDEEVEVPFTALDQYGNAVTKYAALKDCATLSPAYANPTDGGLKWVEKNDGSAKLVFKAATTTSATDTTDALVYLTSVVKDGGNFSSLMLNIKKAAVPTAIVGINADIKTSIAVGNSAKIYGKDVLVQDQYGRTIKADDIRTWLKGAGGNSIVVTSEKPATDATPFTVGLSTGGGAVGADAEKSVITLVDIAEPVVKANDDYIQVAAKTAADLNATEKLVFALSTDGGTTTIATSAKSVTFTKVGLSEYASYEVGDLDLMYNDGVAATKATGYSKTVKVYGVLADGTKVLLPATSSTISIGDAKLDIDEDTNVIDDLGAAGYVANTHFEDDYGKAKNITVDLLVTVNDAGTGAALAILEKKLEVSNADIKVATVTLKSDDVTDGKAVINATKVTEVAPNPEIANDTISATQLKAFIDEVKDQYGVANAGAPVITITNLVKADGSAFKVTTGTNGTSTANIVGAVMGDKFTATYKYASGVSVSIDFTVGLAK